MSQTANDTGREAFGLVSDMEDCLTDVDNLLKAVMLMVAEVDETDGALHCVARMAHSRCKAAEQMRGQLFRITHPDRQHFDREGWPS